MQDLNLIHALTSPSEAERLYAAQDMGDSCRPEFCEPLLTHLLSESSTAVRETIVFHLRRMVCEADYPRLFTLFRSTDAYLRNAAVSIFGAGKDEAIGFLTAHLDHADREVRKLILDALFVCGTPAAVLAIRACLHDPAVNVKITAVEYLGQLEDRESAPEMIDFLARDAEPMLKTAVLESLSLIANASEIEKVVALVAPNGDWTRVDPLFLPEIIRLASRAADPQTIARVLAAVADVSGYAEDTLAAVNEADHRFPRFVHRPGIALTLLNLVQNTDIPERIRHASGEMILSHEVCGAQQLEELGRQLMAEPLMVEAGVRFLHASGTVSAQQTIEREITSSRNQQLRLLMEELQGTASKETIIQKK